MNASKWHRTPILLAAALGAAATALAACGGSSTAPPVGAPPASRHTAVERAATLNWLAMTNQMWTKDNFAALDRVTVGEARTIYRTEQRHAAGDASPSGRTPFRLTGLSITVPCHGWSESGDTASAASGPGAAEASGAGSVFVAYGDTDVFTLGQSMRPEAMVFEQGGGAWKLAAVVNGASGGRAPVACPVRCRSGPGRRRGAGPADYPAALARALDHAATGVAETARVAAPFAVNSFFAGPGLDQRPVRPREQQGPGGRRPAGPAVYPGPRPGPRPAPGGRARILAGRGLFPDH